MKTKPLPPGLAKNYFTHQEALEELGISRTALWRLREEGIFDCREYRGGVIVSRKHVSRYLKNLPEA